ncbi:predicted protein [Naegleria gruberi]|uniref:Predicted protein n=1 Tax=Naegleria gruberi TaxID=5762 RepID=D2VPD0_NAEGR|nr:uncharacterized protein NAEGRDRAFT_51199 [Naegleria gruberi]EFC41410.1 predicted protein [Naegleria gruberi]|eukprot:XP_002674154.1 predicted protein [Naegleria gruberi strain NEG-M]
MNQQYFASTTPQHQAFQLMANQQSNDNYTMISSPNNAFMRQQPFMNVVNQSTMNTLPQLYKQQINMQQQQSILSHQVINQRPNYLQQQYYAQSLQSTPKFFNSTSSAPLLTTSTCNNTQSFFDNNSHFTNSLVLSPEDEELLSHLHDNEMIMINNNNTTTLKTNSSNATPQVVDQKPQQQQSEPSPVNQQEDELSDFVADDNNANWKVSWTDSNREREWQLGEFPQFKACKKRKEFFTAQFENIWYKIPYKYHMLMKVKSFGKDYITVSQDTNGKPLTKKALSELNKNRVKCRVEICFEDGSPVLPSDGQQCCMSNTEHSFDGLNLKLGPFQFNICSYKYGYKKFRLNVILSARANGTQDDSEPTFTDVVTLQSPPFIIKSKKPIARPGAKKALQQANTSDSEQPTVQSPTENSQSDSSASKQTKSNKKGSKRSRESFQALVKATHSPKGLVTSQQPAAVATSPTLNSPRSSSQTSSGNTSPSTIAHYPINNNSYFSNSFEQEQIITPHDMEEQKRAFEHHLLSLLLNSINTPAQDMNQNLMIGNGMSFYQHVPLNLSQPPVQVNNWSYNEFENDLKKMKPNPHMVQNIQETNFDFE